MFICSLKSFEREKEDTSFSEGWFCHFKPIWKPLVPLPLNDEIYVLWTQETHAFPYLWVNCTENLSNYWHSCLTSILNDYTTSLITLHASILILPLNPPKKKLFSNSHMMGIFCRRDSVSSFLFHQSKCVICVQPAPNWLNWGQPKLQWTKRKSMNMLLQNEHALAEDVPFFHLFFHRERREYRRVLVHIPS